ncbi:hypothetical protein BDZ91DRAFT_785927 [Kalaharituber pfeilii]|nr:hypothetical protein BDZ91DRAFT_785927 [Kalaharituber pfeilii]
MKCIKKKMMMFIVLFMPVFRPTPGIVVHGVALRKDSGNVRRWLKEDNKDLKKVVGIRWLRKKDTEGKKTSSVVVYLEDPQDIDRVRLGGRWLKASQYEAERGRR